MPHCHYRRETASVKRENTLTTSCLLEFYKSTQGPEFCAYEVQVLHLRVIHHFVLREPLVTVRRSLQ